ncbi:Cytokinin dehydrogenase [Orobanche gracilis]
MATRSHPSIPLHVSVFLFITISITVANPGFRKAAGPFRNRLHNDTHSIEIASTDYGNIFHNKSSYVLDPSSVFDIIDLIKSSDYKTIAARGNGHSIRGQDMTDGGVVVNMTALSKFDRSRINVVVVNDTSLGSSYADVGGEQLWIDVLRATLKYELAPVSWTDYLYLTVGGTLSNAGISGQAFKHGPQISNVLQLDVVTGKGELITCSPSANPELFYAVLGGLGQFGIITNARIVLNKAPSNVKLVALFYSNFSTFTKDQEYLISSNTPILNYLEGYVIVNESTIDLWSSSSPPIDRTNIVALLKNHNILYAIEMAMYYDSQDADTIDQKIQTLLDKLSYIPDHKYTMTFTFFDFLHKVGNLDTPKTGSKLSHPWLNLFIPKSRIDDFNSKALAVVLPGLNQTTGIFIFYPLNRKKWDNRMSAVTPEEDVMYTLGLLHSTPAGEYGSLEPFNNQILSICKLAGIKVKQYLPHYETQQEWKNHYGSKWNTMIQRKRQFDPKKKMSPGQRIDFPI